MQIKKHAIFIAIFMTTYLVEKQIESIENEKEYKYSLTFNYDSSKDAYYWSFMIYEKKLKNFSDYFVFSKDFPTGSELVFSELKDKIINEISNIFDQDFDQFKKHITNIVFDK